MQTKTQRQPRGLARGFWRVIEWHGPKPRRGRAADRREVCRDRGRVDPGFLESLPVHAGEAGAHLGEK